MNIARNQSESCNVGLVDGLVDGWADLLVDGWANMWLITLYGVKLE